MFDGKLVSSEWSTVLNAARKAGVRFRLNSGRRTMAQQQALYAAHLRHLRGGPWAPLAAVPRATAPHIRVGRPDHACDVNALDGGANRLLAWLRRQGARAALTVSGEPWHIEVPRADLVRLARKFADPLRALNATERRLVTELDRLRAQRKDLARRRVLIDDLTKRRKRIWQLAQPKPKGDGRGWGFGHRRARYSILLSRTKR